MISLKLTFSVISKTYLRSALLEIANSRSKSSRLLYTSYRALGLLSPGGVNRDYAASTIDNVYLMIVDQRFDKLKLYFTGTPSPIDGWLISNNHWNRLVTISLPSSVQAVKDTSPSCFVNLSPTRLAYRCRERLWNYNCQVSTIVEQVTLRAAIYEMGARADEIPNVGVILEAWTSPPADSFYILLRTFRRPSKVFYRKTTYCCTSLSA